MHKTHLLIDNRDVATEDYLEVRDPGRHDDVVGLLAQATPAHVDQAVRAAHRAFAGWRRVPLAERQALLLQAADVLAAEGPKVAELMARESGMPVATNAAEASMAAAVIRDNAELAPEALRPLEVEDEASAVIVEKVPVGVVAGIVPWNAPIILTMRKLAPALVCGNTLVLKPAPSAALGLSALLARIAALFPPGVINVVHGGAEAGQALTTHPLVRKVSFTGGGAVARSIMKAAADTLKGVQFELGGNDPAIVLADADLDQAIPRIVGGAFRRAGQFCFAVKRIYVHTSLHDAFVERFCAEVDRFTVGHPLQAGVTLGPMNNEAQYRYVGQLAERARAAGAEVRVLGTRADPEGWSQGWYLQPMVVPDADPDSELVREEQFGPIVPIVRFDDVEQAVAWANDSELGLASSVWSRDEAAAVAVARRIEAGMTFINNAGTSRLGQRHSPFGGVKQSGIGRESSEVGLGEYVEYHAINVHK
ncbi:aldehyde dehydrogenase family protein [Luteimonas sp. Y-2-2-4F]|nr:aldehyde dehydrogenase family protein [Luteimonas sp. Y-2-2-4F]MCD9033810.1 aldehyde dehydrogenase family protein [Luteimonas sp. Y-2-2-4F]